MLQSLGQSLQYCMPHCISDWTSTSHGGQRTMESLWVISPANHELRSRIWGKILPRSPLVLAALWRSSTVNPTPVWSRRLTCSLYWVLRLHKHQNTFGYKKEILHTVWQHWVAETKAYGFASHSALSSVSCSNIYLASLKYVFFLAALSSILVQPSSRASWVESENNLTCFVGLSWYHLMNWLVWWEYDLSQ